MTILVGIDGSTPSRSALEWAVSRAKSLGEQLRLVHVIDDEWGIAGHDVAEAAEDAAADVIESARRAAAGVPVDELVLHGSPAWTLAGITGPDDLVVVGTHKTGFLHGRALGSRSIVVASLSAGSVAVIPDAAVPRTRQSIVVGVAAGSWSTAVAFGAAEAARTGEELLLVHCVPEDAPASAVEDGHRLLEEARGFVAEHSAAAHVRSRISRRPPAVALLDASRSARLLVVAPTRGSVDRGGFLGSVTHAILLNITCPVVIAR
ncbi:universal stress protein [Salinibacterium soli]|uniref:Universal stress protein n=1 Tax=Antiquaquibacter soli TaxID=3064523 RepID=A0ABT9BP19_9MICO|nr:universal stress protein [Protaetiibacter sp. WY-16]MDO7882778.1 universal stress protein [Protaetiibacter sp. WY-16]